MRVVAFSDIDADAWNCVYRKSLSAWLHHSAEWIEIETQFFVSANCSFGINDRGNLLAICPLFLSGSRNGTYNGETLLHGGIHRHTGLATVPGLSSVRQGQVEGIVMREVLDLAKKHRADRIQLNAHNLAPNQRRKPGEIPFWVMEYGFQYGLGFGPFGYIPAPGFTTLNADMIVELGDDEDRLWNNLAPACRRAGRKAEQAGLRFEIGDGRDTLDSYCALASASAERTGEALPSKRYYRAILDAFSDNGRVAICFAKHAGIAVAALFVLIDKGSISYLAGVSDPKMLHLRPNDFIHWNLIKHAKTVGLHRYRLGPTFPEVPRDWPIAKVSAFKKKFGGKPVPIVQGSLFLNQESSTLTLKSSINSMTQIGSRASWESADDST